MSTVPPGIVTIESAARHLDISARHLNALAAQTPIQDIETIALGRALGTYRLIPQLGVVLLRQLCVPQPWYLTLWLEAVRDLLTSSAWQHAIEQLRALAAAQDRPQTTWRQLRSTRQAHDLPRGRAAVEAMLLSSALGPATQALHEACMSVLAQKDLANLVQIEDIAVDRLEDADSAVILVGATERAYLLPRHLLRRAGLDCEKASGSLIVTHTSAGITLDVWPSLSPRESAAWWLDPDALRDHMVEVGA